MLPRSVCCGRLLLLAGVAAAIVGMPAAWGREKEPPRPPPQVIYVTSGDSLWTIARDYGDPQQDIRRLVWRIQRVNQLLSPSLQPGMSLTLPADCLPRDNSS